VTALRKLSPLPCNFFDHQGECTPRREAAQLAMEVCSQANVRIAELDKLIREDQLDLFASKPIDVALALSVEWQGIHAAGAAEYKRTTGAFWKGCQHG